ncbi:DUF4437 domain-containing protein [Microbulbifer thermotolerans]|uniref:DUF4437 domain-containing protein n=1 Tax=Microbulbifer thermotolerans TaxID=252514 RepID=UPI0034629DD3
MVEINQGPYLLHPPKDAFDRGERSVNIAVANIVWTVPPEHTYSKLGPQIACLWSKLQPCQVCGSFVKPPRIQKVKYRPMLTPPAP